MKVSDCPHAVGTTEHSAWIRDVFIPAVNVERTARDRAMYGAESIGGQFIDGNLLYFQERAAEAARAFNEAVEQLAAAVAPSIDAILELLAALKPNPVLPIIASQRRRRHA
jgi:hypothetical protein